VIEEEDLEGIVRTIELLTDPEASPQEATEESEVAHSRSPGFKIKKPRLLSMIRDFECV